MRSLTVDVFEDIRRFADNIGKVFRKVAYNTKDVFDNRADDLEEIADVAPSSSSSDNEEPQAKSKRKDYAAKFAAHKAATGYSQMCMRRHGRLKGDNDAYL